MPESPSIDHLIYGTPDVDRTVAELEERFGVPFAPGGRHPGWGTRNRILPLGGDRYLEVIGPDEEQVDVPGGRIFGIDDLDAPRMVWWAVRPTAIDETKAALEGAGARLGEVVAGSRRKPDGTTLHWRLTDPRVVPLDGVPPMLIDWGDSVHPGAADSGVRLVGLELRHPDAETLSPLLESLALPEVWADPTAGIVAHFDTPNGPVALR